MNANPRLTPWAIDIPPRCGWEKATRLEKKSGWKKKEATQHQG
jgi:hypothetical protein